MTEATTPIPLSKPISIGGETVTELLMEELRAEHLMELPTGREPNVGELLRVAAAASGKPFGLLKRLGFDDTQAVIEHLGRAMSPFPETGEESSGPSPASSDSGPESSSE